MDCSPLAETQQPRSSHIVDGAGAVRAACGSDKELQAICWVSLISRLFDKNNLQCLKEKKTPK